MKPLHKGLLLAAIQVVLVASLGGKMLYDRSTRPRVWVRTATIDPFLPIRGRYLALRLEVPAVGFPAVSPSPSSTQARGWWTGNPAEAELRLENDRLVAVPAAEGKGLRVWLRTRDGATVADLAEPIDYFIPEHAEDPSRRPAGEELWVEVTVPRKGPPRPIRLGVKKNGILTPLALH